MYLNQPNPKNKMAITLKKVKQIHGDGFEYKKRPGTTPDLTKLKEGQHVCAGGKNYHWLLIEKKK